MPITATCSCGKKMTVGDGLAGKTLKCPKCGQGVFMSASPQAMGAKPKQAVSPKVTINPATIVYLGIVLVLVISSCLFYFGPMRVWNQWEAIGSQADDDVRNVVSFAIQAYLSEEGSYNPAKAHHTPSVDGDIMFFRPFLAMSMPEKIKFTGKTNQGDFEGFYHPSTGEIEADVAYGGLAFAGMVNISKSTGKFHIVGRMKDKQPQAESGGKPLKLVYRKTDDE